MTFLALKGVQKHFGGFQAVEDFNLDVERGEFVSFLGPSGCGKTTTLRMIAGFELPTSGIIEVDGVDISQRPPNQRNVGMVFQSYALFPNMTVAGNIGFGLKVRKKSSEAIRKRVDELLDLIHLSGKGSKYPYELSGGMQQRVALARALAIEPQVLLLDEPLSALDAKIRISLRNEIRSIQRQLGITTVYVTHDQEEALSLSDRVVVMSEGRIEQIGTPFEIYNFPTTSFVAKFVGTLNVLAGRTVDAASGRVAIEGQEIRAAKPIAHANVGDPVSVALRPESVSLGDGPAGSNQLRGTIHDITFLGSIVRIRISLGEGAGTVMFDTFNNPRLALPPIGQPSTVSFPPEACLVLDQRAAAAEPDPVEAKE
jgi:putative spermidine/putrescine transport system ATP-binding protein